MKIRVVLADGRKILREGLWLLLERDPNVEVVGDVEDGPGVAKIVCALAPDLVILNVTLASTPAVGQLIRAIRAACPSTRVLALGVRPDTAVVRQILEAGAAGCLTHECAAADLLTAVRAVTTTAHVYLSPRIAQAVVSGYVLPMDALARRRALSAREREILRRIADGATTKTIAASLDVSTRTIETHRRGVMQKLGLHSVAELTKYAVREGLTSVEVPA